MIKAIVFDCFGVLSHVDLWREFLAELSGDELVNRAEELNRQCDAGLITRDDFFNQIEELTGKTLHDVESLSSTEPIKNHKLIEYIKTLKNAGYKIGLLSNIGSNWITDEFLTGNEQVLFDAMVFSHEVGAIKPQPEIYEIMCNRLNVDPSEVLFTDDVEAYCEAARALGMQAVQYRSTAQLKRDFDAILNHE